ncbi:Na(+)/H(+) antiporter subunit B [Pseudohongiella sp.]|uniref:Na+/H+ antiporter MnhB subunit-related protein domain-containing protein n=1 Tax=marine sediment metagenome TaxID=412755 RepID=A0A0F9YI69_9ZZZZ|nr:Na(+)/H(+) antiporter subunit B [Pseudohongiella sp.]HDZ08559.1 Na(+)/H(+) antiporter subunit B [Pseudohongiella sp.]HEA61703.1 Na(+)/H(+) antiporter subunit B [Pseudohongiella sp.]
MNDHMILRVVGKFLIPYIMLFALYVQFHGDFGPGGGFQAGVIFASAFVIHTLLFGVRATQKIAPEWILRIVASGGVLLYAGVGVASLLLGANYLDYNVLGAYPVAGQHLGIILVEFGVGLTVTAVIMLMFFAFAARGEPEGDAS